MGYLRDTVKGVSWVGAFRAVNRTVIFVKTAILARLLTPDQFGIFGIAGLVLALLEVLTETGINVFLVQEKSKIDEYIDTAWIVSILRGILISILIVVTAPFVASFFHSPDSYKVILFISLVPFVRGFINPSSVKFQKNLMFDKEFWYKGVILIADTLVAVVASYLTHSAFAIAYALLAGVIVEVILSFIVVKPRPKFLFNLDKVKRVIGRGKWVTAYGIFTYLFQNGDNMVVGRLLGEGPLGIYSVAYKISSLPISEISDVFSRVTFPVFVKISTNHQRLRKAYFKTLFASSFLIFLAGFGIFLFSKQIVFLVLGPAWGAAIPVLKILSIFGIVKGISSQAQAVLFSLGKQEYVAVITFVGLVGLFIPIIPLTLKYGLIGTGIAVIIGSVATLPLIIFYLLKVIRR